MGSKIFKRLCELETEILPFWSEYHIKKFGTVLFRRQASSKESFELSNFFKFNEEWRRRRHEYLLELLIRRNPEYEVRCSDLVTIKMNYRASVLFSRRHGLIKTMNPQVAASTIHKGVVVSKTYTGSGYINLDLKILESKIDVYILEKA